MKKRIIVTKEVEKGVVNFIIEGDDGNYGRTFCGHTGESNSSLYKQDMNNYAFHAYGAYQKNFAYEKTWPHLEDKDSAQEYADKIVKRILMVRKWVNDCKELDKKSCSIGIAVIPD